MSSKVMKVFGAVMIGLAFVAGATQGCGGSSGGANIADLCNRSCTKTVECLPGLFTVEQCKTQCNAQSMGSGGQRCTNEAALVAKANECLAKASCAEFLACGETAPDCEVAASGTAGTSGAGTGGTTGTAGTGSSTGAAGFTFDGSVPFDASGLLGAGGSAGSTCGTACTKAEACCKALPGANPASCTFVSQCESAGANQAQVVQACNGILQTAALLGASTPAACK
jgi:hypothetical protein